VFNSPDAAGAVTRERSRDFTRSAKRTEWSEKGIADVLADASLFSQCSKRELRLVAKLAKTKSVTSGTNLTIENEPGDTMFVILSGRATVSKGNRKIAELGMGDVVGELAALSRGPRNATVTAATDVEIASIGRREILRLVEDAPGFSRKLLEAMANRIRELDKKLVC
jgi:CRP-like cAMP-binding protein